jgi:hypothetical protein
MLRILGIRKKQGNTKDVKTESLLDEGLFMLRRRKRRIRLVLDRRIQRYTESHRHTHHTHKSASSCQNEKSDTNHSGGKSRDGIKGAYKIGLMISERGSLGISKKQKNVVQDSSLLTILTTDFAPNQKSKL